MKVKLDIPYPNIMVEKKNSYYADILSEDYAGGVSELTAVLLYSYQHFLKFDTDGDFSKTIEEISIVEMLHMEMLGKIIKLLGKEPVYSTCEAFRGDCIMWNSNNVNYASDLRQMLKIDINSEKQAIVNYKHHLNLIDDKHIKAVLSRIILDEQHHLKIFETLLEQLC